MDDYLHRNIELHRTTYPTLNSSVLTDRITTDTAVWTTSDIWTTSDSMTNPPRNIGTKPSKDKPHTPLQDKLKKLNVHI
jgi:hypothetical protein